LEERLGSGGEVGELGGVAEGVRVRVLHDAADPSVLVGSGEVHVSGINRQRPWSYKVETST
jgi:hypothetical protein